MSISTPKEYISLADRWFLLTYNPESELKNKQRLPED
jgi:hypothetical protein